MSWISESYETTNILTLLTLKMCKNISYYLRLSFDINRRKYQRSYNIFCVGKQQGSEQYVQSRAVWFNALDTPLHSKQTQSAFSKHRNNKNCQHVINLAPCTMWHNARTISLFGLSLFRQNHTLLGYFLFRVLCSGRTIGLICMNDYTFALKIRREHRVQWTNMTQWSNCIQDKRVRLNQKED